MSTTPSWAAVKRHAEAQIASAMEALSVAPLDKVAGLQAQVRVWRDVLELPTTLAPDTKLAPDPISYS